MNLLSDFKGFLRALRGPVRGPSQRSSLARTLKESTHVRGGSGTAMPQAGTEQQHEIVVEGHEQYDAALEKDS